MKILFGEHFLGEIFLGENFFWVNFDGGDGGGEVDQGGIHHQTWNA